MGELAKLHGGELSAGVCAIVTTAAQLMADSRWARAKAAATGDRDLLRLAMNLSTSARQAERDAWELASREAKARPQPASAYPWIASDEPEDSAPAPPSVEPTDRTGGDCEP